jgi:hypothetical protein
MNESKRQDLNGERELLQGKLSEVLPMDKVEIDHEALTTVISGYAVRFQELFSSVPLDNNMGLFVFEQSLRELQIETAIDMHLLDKLHPLRIPASELFVGNFFSEEEVAFYDSETPWSIYIEALGRYMAGAYPKTA